jgi:hypothetical protein
MSAAGSAHNFFGVQLTLVASTVTNLLKALQAIEPTVPPTVRSLLIQADSSVAGELLIGDAGISATRYGLALTSTASIAPIQSFSVGGSVQDVAVVSFYLFSTTSGLKVNVLGYC